MSEPLPFPRPAFSAEQAFDFSSMIREHVSALIHREQEALGVLLVIAAHDDSKPGIIVRCEFKGLHQDTYQFESTVAFDEAVPRGEVRYAPLPTDWLKP